MDEEKTPADILDEILNRRPEQPRLSPDRPPKFDPPVPADIPPPAMEKPPLAQRLLPWVLALLGGAVLVLVLCGMQLASMNTRLDDLQASLEEIQAVDALQKEADGLEQQLKQAEQTFQKIDQRLWDNCEQISSLSQRKCGLDYLWHIGQFMERGDYPMAALAAVYSAADMFNGNPMQEEQYAAYLLELGGRGYLKLPINYPNEFSTAWDPNINPYMAALGILWAPWISITCRKTPATPPGSCLSIRMIPWALMIRLFPIPSSSGTAPVSTPLRSMTDSARIWWPRAIWQKRRAAH